MPEINAEALRLVKEALERYEHEVDATDLTPESKRTYIGHAQQFVRWLDDDFEPGVNVRHRRSSNQPR